jgi:hypothetical protein
VPQTDYDFLSEQLRTMVGELYAAQHLIDLQSENRAVRRDRLQVFLARGAEAALVSDEFAYEPFSITELVYDPLRA